MVKASEFKNVCKAVNDRKLAELKKEIIEILKKQDEKDVKKAIDYFNSQEEHYTHLEKSLISGKWIQKAGYGVGTVRIWKGKKYKKIAPGKWARVFDKEGRGTNIAIGKLIARVQKIDNVEDLMAFVMENKQRFVDENGIDLPVLDKLRAAVDAKNNGDMGSKVTSKPAEKEEESKNPIDKRIQQEIEYKKYDEMNLDQLNAEIKELTLKQTGRVKEGSDEEKIVNGVKKYVLNLRKQKESESEAEKTQNRSEAMKGNKNAYKGKAEEVANKKLLSKEEMLKKPISKIYQYANADVYDMEKFKTIDEALEDSLETHKGSIEIGELTEDTIAERVGKEWAKKQNHDIAREILKDEKDGKLVVNEDGIFEEKKEPEKKTKNSKPSTGVFAPSESTDMETKKAIAENKSVGENEVQLPYSKELEAEIKSLKNCASTDPTREFMNHVYYENGNLVATDGIRMKLVKVGELDGIENGSYVDIDISKNGINLKKREGMEGKQYPNYSRVIPDDLSQKVTLKNDVIKEKIKEMKKDGAIDKKVGRVQLEFKDGKVYLDDTEIGEAQNINLKYSDDWGPARNETNLINVNADYLVNALNGNSSILMLGERSDKAMGISTDSTTNIIMPMSGSDKKMDYGQGRQAKKDANDKKSALKEAYKKTNEEFVASIKEHYGDRFKRLSDSAAANLTERMADMSDETLKLNYDRLKFNLDKVMDKKEYITEDTKVDNKLKLGLRDAILYQTTAKEHPEVIERFEEELEKRGITVKKSLFDDFIVDMFVEEDEEEEPEEENESLFNDYSAELPELFNSTEMMVSEAFNRCNCL